MKKRVLTVITSTLLVSGVIATSAHAMGRTDDPEFNTYMIKSADTDADGKISQEEFLSMSMKMAKKEFMMMDMNDDGAISKDEFMMHNR